jgi:hypothetical protein
MGANAWGTIVQKSDLQNFSLRQKSSNVEIISFAQLYYIVFLFFCQEEDYPTIGPPQPAPAVGPGGQAFGEGLPLSQDIEKIFKSNEFSRVNSFKIPTPGPTPGNAPGPGQG